MLRDWVLPTLLERQEMGRNVQSQSRGKEVRGEKQRLSMKHPCRIYCKTSSPLEVPSPRPATCDLAHVVSSWQSLCTCQVLLGAREVEEDENCSARNSRNFQTKEMTSRNLIKSEMQRRWIASVR